MRTLSLYNNMYHCQQLRVLLFTIIFHFDCWNVTVCGISSHFVIDDSFFQLTLILWWCVCILATLYSIFWSSQTYLSSFWFHECWRRSHVIKITIHFHSQKSSMGFLIIGKLSQTNTDRLESENTILLRLTILYFQIILDE